MGKTAMDSEIAPHVKREFVFQTAGILPPNGVLFGFNTIERVGEQAAKLGARQVILVTDANMVKLGYADLVREALQKEGLKVEVFGNVEPEPHIETANAIHDMLRRKRFDLVVGLGGGSALDMAKMASIVATSDKEPFELVKQIVIEKKEVSKPALKKILIPTTSGTGSEVSKFFVVSVGKEKYFPASSYAYPEIAIIDPGLTVSMPPKVTASTGIDALSHAIDSVMNKLTNPLYDSLAFGGIELISKYLSRATSNGQDLEARYYMSLAATMSMISMTGTGALYSHSISYVMAMFQPTAHGVGCGVGLPYTMAFNLPVIEEKMALIARALGERTDSLSPRAAGQKAVQQVYDLTKKVKMPVSIKEMGFQQDDVHKMADTCITKHPRINNPRPMSKEECLALFDAMWEGNISRI
jgi:alcohol dehydrogenase class IV